MKVRYSLEAFALAFVLYTTGLELALVAGAIIVAATILGDVLAGMAGKTVGAVVAVIAAFAALYFSVSYVGLGAGDYSDYVGAALVAVLIGKHVMDGVDAASTGEILKQNYVALIILAVMALVREFLGGGAVFGYEVADFGVISSAYQNDYFGLIFGGLGILRQSRSLGFGRKLRQLLLPHLFQLLLPCQNIHGQFLKVNQVLVIHLVQNGDIL